VKTDASVRADVARHDVVLLKWPERDEERAVLEQQGRPRLLLVSPDADPPATWTALEDWIRRPADPQDLYARVASLRHRTSPSVAVELRDGAIAQRGSMWVAVPSTEMAVLEVLVDHVGRVATRADLLRAASEENLNTAIHRLRTRLRAIGVKVRTVRGKGFVLELDECPGS